MRKKMPSRLAKAMLDTAADMRRAGIISKAAGKITLRHLGRPKRHSAKGLAAEIKRGKTRSDWAKAADMSEKEIEASIAADPD